jgi:ABC-type transport system substrate-binding protein
MGTLTLGVMATSVLAACGPGTPPTAPAATSAPAAVATAAPTAAPNPTTAGAAPIGTLRYANADFSNESTDPINLESAWGFAMYDSLLTFDPQGSVVGNLAEKFDLSADGLTWTFKIRRGVKFHNGDPLTADDVVFSLQRFGSKDSTNPWSPLHPQEQRIHHRHRQFHRRLQSPAARVAAENSLRLGPHLAEELLQPGRPGRLSRRTGGHRSV